MLTSDYYRTLGLTLEASAQDIKKAYRRLAKQYHPDRNRGNSKSEERLKEINEAYQILGDEENRKRYNMQYRKPSENYVFYEEGMDDDFGSVLRKFFQKGFDAKRTGGCRRMGFARRGCGRWKR
ncbi:MAG: DnaJ domain-containing protein [Thermodesulfobacteriota bacterium]|nr:DnaJ domain-containing protein [Thermodesulfobacteriota bacterium]